MKQLGTFLKTMTLDGLFVLLPPWAMALLIDKAVGLIKSVAPLAHSSLDS
jgi:hypothetical protein